MSCFEAEVVIVGAGPAGATLALELARRGRDVLILERARFPRDKPCGDCVNPGAVAELERLGVADRLRESLRPNPLFGWRVEAPDGRVLEADFGPDDDGGRLTGWSVRRREFDAALLGEAERAGVRVQFGIRVSDVIREGGRVAGLLARDGAHERIYRAAFVGAADGLKSVVQRRLGLASRAPRLRKLALVGHLASCGETGRFGELRVGGGRCCGFAPLPSGGNVTLVVSQREAVALAGQTREFFLTGLAGFPAVAERVRRAGLERGLMTTGPFDRPLRRPWAPGVLLAGDAAGYYDPFTGQGIYQALRSARYAAESIDIALRDRSDEHAACRSYGDRFRREFEPKRRLQEAIEWVVSRPFAMSTTLVVVGSNGNLTARRLLKVTGDLEPPLSLLDPWLWARRLVGIGGSR